MRVVFLLMPLKFFDSQGRDVESCGDHSWDGLLSEPDDLSGGVPVSC